MFLAYDRRRKPEAWPQPEQAFVPAVRQGFEGEAEKRADGRLDPAHRAEDARARGEAAEDVGRPGVRVAFRGGDQATQAADEASPAIAEREPVALWAWFAFATGADGPGLEGDNLG